MFWIVLLTVLVLYILRISHEKIHAFYLALRIPGPIAYPIVGNALLFLFKTLPENFAMGYQLTQKYGVFYRIWLGPELDIVVSDPKDLEILLSSPRHIDKASNYRFLKPWLNEGLLLSTGKKWHDRRKLLTPAFHFNILEEFVKVFDRVGNTLVEKLKKVDAKDEIEFFPIAVLYALDVMCETAMGVSIDALSKPNSEYVQAVKKITYVVQTRMINFILQNSFLFQFSELGKQQAAALNVLHGFTDDVIRKRRQTLLAIKLNNIEGKGKDEDEEIEQNEAIGIKSRRALLDLLLHSTIEGKPLDDLEIREEVDTFMFEGHDTTTSGITFCLYNISKHAEIQNKCYNEIIAVIGKDSKTPMTLSLLNQLSYLELAVKESLRLFPSVPYIGRLAMEDIELTNKRIIPRGANIFIPIHTMHRNEKVFKNANQFIPERLSVERSMEKQNSFNLIPFAAGPRNCIGQKFAINEIKSVISKILLNFEVSLAKGSEAEPLLSTALILKPESTIKFHFRRRE